MDYGTDVNSEGASGRGSGGLLCTLSHQGCVLGSIQEGDLSGCSAVA
jgi:hypothetical protein